MTDSITEGTKALTEMETLIGTDLDIARDEHQLDFFFNVVVLMGVIFLALSSQRIRGGMLCQRETLSSHFAFLRKLHKSKASSPLPDPIIPSKTQLRAPMQMRAFRLCERRQTEADTRKTDNEGANGSGSHCWQAAGVLFGQSCRINDHRIPAGTQGAAKEKTKVSSAKMLIRPWVEGYKPFSRM